jgi:hypothetical protein
MALMRAWLDVEPTGNRSDARAPERCALAMLAARAAMPAASAASTTSPPGFTPEFAPKVWGADSAASAPVADSSTVSLVPKAGLEPARHF